MNQRPANSEDNTPVPGNLAQAVAEQQPREARDSAVDPLVSDALRVEEERLKAFAHLLDSAIRLPGGFRIGLDGIVGLVPGVGDLLGAGLSGYFIYAASRLDIPGHVIVRMILNTVLETVIGLVPLFGDAFDFVFKANERNARLLRQALEARDAGREAAAAVADVDKKAS